MREQIRGWFWEMTRISRSVVIQSPFAFVAESDSFLQCEVIVVHRLVHLIREKLPLYTRTEFPLILSSLDKAWQRAARFHGYLQQETLGRHFSKENPLRRDGCNGQHNLYILFSFLCRGRCSVNMC
jgi:hypothetical protein